MEGSYVERDELYSEERHLRIVRIAQGKKVIGCKWVHAKKQASQDGATVCY